MIYILPIIYFITICLGLGFSLMYLLKINIKNPIEKYIMMLGFGLGVFPILSILLNTIHIPLHWITFLVLSMIIPIIKCFSFKFNFKKIPLTDCIVYIFLFLIFFTHLFVYIEGSFKYPYLEDGDPWVHADVAQYVGDEMTYSLPSDSDDIIKYTDVFHYIEPYPPTFAVLNGIIYQINPDLKWNLKFFNSFIVSLGILFIFFFIFNLTKRRSSALLSAFLLAIIPCYLSHFIFATSLGVTLFFPAMYAFSKINQNKGYLFIASIISASIFVTQPITAGMFGIVLGLYWLVGVIIKRDLQLKQLSAIILSGILALLYYIPTFAKFTFNKFAEKLGFYMFSGEVKEAVSSGIIYTFKDYFFSPLSNKIDQAYGLGPVLLIILGIALLVPLFVKNNEEGKKWLWVSVIMVILTFIATQSNRFEYTFFPHRVWVFLALYSVVLISLTIPALLRAIPKKVRYGLWIFLVIGLVLSSGYPKYKVQTSQWPPDYGLFPPVQSEKGVYSPELMAYLWMEDNLEWGSQVWISCWNSDYFAAGSNMKSLTKDRQRRDYNLSEHTSQEIMDFAKEKKYDYIMFGTSCIEKRNYPFEQVQAILNEIGVEHKAVYVDQYGAFIFEV